MFCVVLSTDGDNFSSSVLTDTFLTPKHKVSTARYNLDLKLKFELN